MPLLALVLLVGQAADGVTARLSGDGKAIEVAGATDPDKLSVRVGGGTEQDIAARPAMTGTTKAGPGVLRFEPRFPLTPGVTYRVSYDGTTVDVTVPKPDRKPTTTVVAVYPTAEKVPENTLRLYVQFSGPMARGGGYTHVKLMCGDKEVKHPFLELDEELWSPDLTRFTLLFDPGRVKHGLRPREEAGPILEAGKKYSLVIDRGWEDENGAPLKASFTKEFAAGPADETAIDPAKHFHPGEAPKAGTSNGYTVKFGGKLLDHALARRMIWVVGPDGKKLPGEMAGGERWVTFKPAADWKAGEYKLVIDTRLEDVSGNRVGEPFEVDVFKPVERRIEAKTVERPFVVR